MAVASFPGLLHLQFLIAYIPGNEARMAVHTAGKTVCVCVCGCMHMLACIHVLGLYNRLEFSCCAHCVWLSACAAVKQSFPFEGSLKVPTGVCSGQEASTYTHTHIRTHVHTHAPTPTHTYTHMHTYTHTHVHTLIHTHVHVHTHTHTHTQ